VRKQTIITDQTLEAACASDYLARLYDGIYLMCRNLPDHPSLEIARVKIGLVRRVPGVHAQSGRECASIHHDYHDDIIGRILMDSRLDLLLDSLREIPSLNTEYLGEVVRCHAYLAEEIRKVTGLQSRALASRYLHFHLPRIVPIYDRQSALVLGKLCSNRIHRKDIPSCGDSAYSQFCSQILVLQKDLQENFDTRLNLRQIDRLLILLTKKEKS